MPVRHLTQSVATAGTRVPLTQRAIAAPATGASRTANIVTITTSTAHQFRPGIEVVLAGITDASFNGRFRILATPTATTFTYVQAGPDATSGNGTAIGVVRCTQAEIEANNGILGAIFVGDSTVSSANLGRRLLADERARIPWMGGQDPYDLSQVYIDAVNNTEGVKVLYEEL